MSIQMPKQQIAALPPGANSPQQAAVINMQNKNMEQNNANQSLAKGRNRGNRGNRGNKGKKGGGTEMKPVYPQSAASSGVNDQAKANFTNISQNNENTKGDAGAFTKGGRRCNKSKKAGKRTSKRRKTRRHKTRRRRHRK